MRRLIKSAASSRAGQALCAANLAVVGWFYFFRMTALAPPASGLYSVGNGGFIAGRWVDFDSSLLFALIPLNLVPLLVCNTSTNLVIEFFPRLDAVAASWAYASLLLALTSAQWLVVGSLIEKMVKLYRGAARVTKNIVDFQKEER